MEYADAEIAGCADCGARTTFVEVPHISGPDLLQIHTCPECGHSFARVDVSASP